MAKRHLGEKVMVPMAKRDPEAGHVDEVWINLDDISENINVLYIYIYIWLYSRKLKIML